MSTYNKQQPVNFLPINFNSGDVINHLLFQEITTVIKNKKREIVKKFKNACYSRKNRAEMFPDNEEKQKENSEIWAICLTDKNFPCYEEMEFQGENCQICGDYKLSWRNEISEIPENIKCNCF